MNDNDVLARVAVAACQRCSLDEAVVTVDGVPFAVIGGAAMPKDELDAMIGLDVTSHWPRLRERTGAEYVK